MTIKARNQSSSWIRFFCGAPFLDCIGGCTKLSTSSMCCSTSISYWTWARSPADVGNSSANTWLRVALVIQDGDAKLDRWYLWFTVPYSLVLRVLPVLQLDFLPWSKTWFGLYISIPSPDNVCHHSFLFIEVLQSLNVLLTSFDHCEKLDCEYIMVITCVYIYMHICIQLPMNGSIECIASNSWP